MFDSYELPHVTHREKFNWEEQFYEALLGGRDPRENCVAAESIAFARLSLSETVPMSNEERSAMDDCLFDLRRFQVQELNYPPIETSAQNTNMRSEEELIEEAFYDIVGRPMLMRERPFFMRKKARVA
ncbi:MAG: hypothetical protein WBX16_01850 [Candidatus Acidiferrales bacterium]